MNCGRCEVAVSDETAEWCWWCVGPLCSQCWETVGHCGHPEADTVNRASKLMTYEQRRELVGVVIPDDEKVWWCE